MEKKGPHILFWLHNQLILSFLHESYLGSPIIIYLYVSLDRFSAVFPIAFLLINDNSFLILYTVHFSDLGIY